jgi:hypothetical protein
LAFFLDFFSTSSLITSLLDFLGCFFLPGVEAFLALDNSTSESFSGEILQKVAPKFLIMEGERSVH